MGVSPRPRLRLPIDSSLGVTHRGRQPGAESERAMVPYLPFAIYILYHLPATSFIVGPPLLMTAHTSMGACWYVCVGQLNCAKIALAADE